MKVLLAAYNYPQLSETYISAEIDFFLRSGIEIEVWAPVSNPMGAIEQVKVHRRTLKEAVDTFHPDVVHCHYLHFAPSINSALSGTKIPLTVRGHSFDFSVERAESAAALDHVGKVYLFPHLARLCRSNKIVPLPVAYNSKVYRAFPEKDKKLVLRLVAGKQDKGLRDFCAVSRLCPDHTFTLGISDLSDGSNYSEKMKAINKSVGGRVELIRNIPWSKAQDLTKLAGIYLGTSDPSGHAFGMPISIAESLSTGSLVFLRRDVPAAHEYLGDAGLYYSSPEEAAELIRSTLAWSDEAWKGVQKAALERAQMFTDEVVLSKIISDWKALMGKL